MRKAEVWINSKYQEAKSNIVNTLVRQIGYEAYKNLYSEDFDTLQELVDKATPIEVLDVIKEEVDRYSNNWLILRSEIKMITKLEHNFTKNTKIYFEHNVEINENSYLIIFGHHINGGFIAIPDWNICCEASANSDSSYYNQMKLIDAGMNGITAKEISEYINSWIEINSQNVGD